MFQKHNSNTDTADVLQQTLRKIAWGASSEEFCAEQRTSTGMIDAGVAVAATELLRVVLVVSARGIDAFFEDSDNVGFMRWILLHTKSAQTRATMRDALKPFLRDFDFDYFPKMRLLMSAMLEHPDKDIAGAPEASDSPRIMDTDCAATEFFELACDRRVVALKGPHLDKLVRWPHMPWPVHRLFDVTRRRSGFVLATRSSWPLTHPAHWLVGVVCRRRFGPRAVQQEIP